MFKFIGKCIKYFFVAMVGLAFLGLIIGIMFSGNDDTGKTPAQVDKSEIQTAETAKIDNSIPEYIKKTWRGKSLTELERADDILAENFNKATRQLMSENNQSKIDSLNNVLDMIALNVDAIALEKEALKNNQKDQIKSQFSSWDGSHRNFVKLVKKNMNDPDSFDHVETRYAVLSNNSGIQVSMKFRGKNAFGGTVLNHLTAQFDMNGNFIRMVE